MGCYDGMKAHSIVQSGFDMTCSVRSSTVKIRHADGQRLNTAFEIRTNRCSKYTELIFFCRLYSDNRADTEHIRSDIKWSTWSVRRYIGCIGLYSIDNCFNEFIFRECRHLKTLCRICETGCIQVRAKDNSTSVFCCISFHSFENCLSILKNSCTLTHHNIRIFCQGSLVPASIFKICNKSFVCWYITET